MAVLEKRDALNVVRRGSWEEQRKGRELEGGTRGSSHKEAHPSEHFQTWRESLDRHLLRSISVEVVGLQGARASVSFGFDETRRMSSS